jgi:tetratricopeptide (TPR) repeat protein
MAERISMSRTGDLTEARSWAEKALELAKKLNNTEVMAKSYASLGEILSWLGDIEKFFEYMERALKIALENDYTDTAIFAYNDLGAYSEKEENERSFEYYTKGFELAKKVGDVFWMSWIAMHLAETHIGRGDMSKAMAFAEESLALDKKANNLSHLPLSLDEVGFIHQIMGEWDKSEQYYKEASSISQRLDDFQAIADVFWCLGMLQIDKGEYTKARENFEKAIEVLEKHGAESYKMWYSTGTIFVDIELGELDKAKNTLDILQKFVLEVWKRKMPIAFVNALRAKLLGAQKKWEESVMYFEKSIQEFEALDARRWNMYPFAKRILYEYAQVYLERDEKDDREKAHSLLNQALEIFQKIGAKKDIEKVIAKKKFLTA